MKSKVLILVFGLIVVGILAVAGYWFYQNSKELAVSEDIRELKVQSSSDEVPQIEEDLEDTDLTSLDAELDDIEAELSAQ